MLSKLLGLAALWNWAQVVKMLVSNRGQSNVRDRKGRSSRTRPRPQGNRDPDLPEKLVSSPTTLPASHKNLTSRLLGIGVSKHGIIKMLRLTVLWIQHKDMVRYWDWKQATYPDFFLKLWTRFATSFKITDSLPGQKSYHGSAQDLQVWIGLLGRFSSTFRDQNCELEQFFCWNLTF